MTDKQIIIDDVDVSGCPYYIDSEGGCSSHDCECIKCVHNVCFYKDYKAKEQECEGLKKELAKVYEDIKLSPLCYKCDEEECLRKEINQLKAENDTLFKAIEEVNKINKKLNANLLDQEAETLKAGGIIHTLEEALTEIKEIANNTYLKYHTKTEYDAVIRLILQKCEVLDV